MRHWCVASWILASASWVVAGGNTTTTLSTRTQDLVPSTHLRGGQQPRRLQDCFDQKTLDGPFNGKEEIVPVVGYFFEVQAQAVQVTINTVELDVRAGLGNNLAIDIYTTNTPVQQAFSDSLNWGLIARTSLRLNPDGASGALLASHQFTDVTIEPNQRKSFYFRMQGPYLDYTTNSLAQSGLQAISGDDLLVYAGYHLDQSDGDFPNELRSNIAPIMAGKLHYTVGKDCENKNIVSISSEFIILVDIALLASDFTNVNQAMNSAVNSLVTTDEKIAILANGYNLQMSAAGTTTTRRDYAGDCPALWATCTAVVGTVPLEFSDEITEGDVNEEFYKHTETFSQTMLGALAEGTQGAYVGLLDSVAEFVVVLEGVSQTDIMDSVQGLYFEDRAVAQANSRLPEGLARVFNFRVSEQRLFGFDSIEVKGTVHGAILSIYSDVNFAERVQTALKQYKDEWIASIKFYQNYPGEMAEENRFEFFANMDDIPITVVTEVGATNPPTPSPVESDPCADGVDSVKCAADDGGFDIMYIVYGGAALGALIILLLVYCCCKQMMKNRKDADERKLQREESKRAQSLLININNNEEKPPASIGVSKSTRRRSGTGLTRNSFSEATDTYFQDEHSLGGSTTETNSKSLLYSAPSSRRMSARSSKIDLDSPTGGRRASASYSVSDHSRKSKRRASTGSLDSADAEDEDRIFSSGRRSMKEEYDDYDDYKPRRSHSASRHSTRGSSRGGLDYDRGEISEHSSVSYRSSRKHRSSSRRYDDDDDYDESHRSSYSRSSLSSRGYDDDDYSESRHSSSGRSKKKKKKKKKKKSKNRDDDSESYNLGSSRHKLKKTPDDDDEDEDDDIDD